MHKSFKEEMILIAWKIFLKGLDVNFDLFLAIIDGNPKLQNRLRNETNGGGNLILPYLCCKELFVSELISDQRDKYCSSFE